MSDDVGLARLIKSIRSGTVTRSTQDPNAATEALISTKHANCPNGSLEWLIVTYTIGIATVQLALAIEGSASMVFTRHAIAGTYHDTWTPVSNNLIGETHIPGIPASKVTSGVFGAERIPSLPVTKITGTGNITGRDIYVSTAAPDNSIGKDGDIWFQI